MLCTPQARRSAQQGASKRRKAARHSGEKLCICLRKMLANHSSSPTCASSLTGRYLAFPKWMGSGCMLRLDPALFRSDLAPLCFARRSPLCFAPPLFRPPRKCRPPWATPQPTTARRVQPPPNKDCPAAGSPNQSGGRASLLESEHWIGDPAAHPAIAGLKCQRTCLAFASSRRPRHIVRMRGERQLLRREEGVNPR